MPEIDANGVRLRYELSGFDGAPVVLLSNALGTNLHLWDDQAEALEQRYRVLRYDGRGHGESEAPADGYSIEALAADAAGLLDALGVERAHVCGLSLGGMVAQALALARPERVQSLILCATAAHMPPRELWEQRIATVEQGGMSGVVDAVVERWFTAGFRERAPQAVARVRAMILATPAQGYAGCCRAIRDMDLRAAIGQITAPTRIIVGDKDPATPVASAEAIHERIAGSTMTVIEDAAHLCNVEQRRAFDAALIDALARHGQA